MYADFFLFGFADVAFHTAWSLFGHTATELAGIDKDDFHHPFGRYKISSSECEAPTARYPCAQPRAPSFCMHGVLDLDGTLRA